MNLLWRKCAWGLVLAAMTTAATVETNSAIRLDRTNLLAYRNQQGEIAPVRSTADWQKRRAAILESMQEVMGPLPGKARHCPLDVQIEEEVDCGDYIRRRLSYASEPGSHVPAYLLIPKDALTGKKKYPAVLCLHATEMSIGYKTTVGLGGPYPAYAAELAQRGFVTLSPSYPLMANYQPDLKALGYESGTMKAIWDNMRGLDLLDTLPFVRKGEYGAIGHSLGGHNAIYTAVFDSRIKVVVSSCGFDSFRDYHRGDITGWTSPRYMPKLRNYPAGETPFDFHELIGALAPRACFINAPLRDSNFQWRSVDKVVKAAAQVYNLYGVPGNLRVEHPDCEHDFPEAMRQKAYEVLAQLDPIPPDLPLPAASASRASWLRGANMLQPAGHSQFTALMSAKDRAPRLKTDLGFNTIVVAPADVNNTIVGPKDQMTAAQFREGVTAYRAAGYRLILYTSVMASGMVPEFQSGQLARDHPDWLQRDPQGNPVMVYGVPWLCPSTPARDYALDYALRIAREYQPDGILLDNNEFFQAQAGWTCHCAACTKAFREYARQRLGDAETKRLFGVAPEQLEIPTQEGPLYALWLRWRNRVWAGINESFRDQLRKLDPGMILFANTQYLFDDAMLGTDLQYDREDIVVSESCNLSSRKMSEKLVLGHAMAEGRPLWNYIGTFVNGEDYTGLKPAGIIAPLIAATLAHDARPWIVDGFDEGQTDAEARREMAALLGWHAAHPELFANQPWAPVGVVFSLGSRNVVHRALIPPHLTALLHAGVPVAGLRDDTISSETLRPFRVVTIETAACLDETASRALAKWVRSGGVLIAAADVGCYDELGQNRAGSALWQALGLDAPPGHETEVGHGKVLAPETGAFAQKAITYTTEDAFRFTGGSGIEVVPYRGTKWLVLQLVRHEAAAPTVTVHLPASFQPAKMTAQWLTPGSDDTQTLRLSPDADGYSLTLTNAPVYSVVKISLR